MQHSLTVLLPVCNVESTLAVSVREVLEVVSELTDCFELVIVDDGSEDSTSEVAEELIHDYPQVRSFRHGVRLGRDAAIRTGLEQSSGQIVFLHDDEQGLAVDGLGKLWKAACQHETEPDRTSPDRSSQSPECTWSRFSRGHETTRGGYQMFERQVIEQLHCGGQPTRPNYMGRQPDSARKDSALGG
ncbi:MAG: glycosyltransferase family 2 protein [Thermoguttaceae bacterium]